MGNAMRDAVWGGGVGVRQLVERLFVPGRPRTKGSMTPVPIPGRPGKFRMQQTVKDSEPWQRDISNAVIRTYGTPDGKRFRLPAGWPVEGPVVVGCIFVMPYEAGDTPESAEYPIERRYGDVDKLLRNVLDALSKVVYADDQQVVDAASAKQFVGPGHPDPGLQLDVWAL